MKNNKGFAPIAIVLIIIAVLAVGGVAYFVGKSSNTLPNVVNNLPQENQNNVITPPVQNTQADCLPTTAPWIKVVSPNGGETYTAGQQVKIKWQSCNISTGSNVSIFLDGFESMNSPYTWGALVSAGSYTWTVPDMSYFHASTTFALGFNAGGVHALSGAFTINAPKISTILPQYIGAGFNSWPPVIQTSSTAYSCTVGSTGGDTPTITAQRVIGTRTYCVSKGGDGYAGGYGYTYNYTTSNGSGTKTTNFSLLYQSCGGYGVAGTQPYDQCHANQTTFNNNLDALINSLM